MALTNVSERFANVPDAIRGRIVQKIAVDCTTGCWIWSACVGSNGYGQIWLNGMAHKAHRVVYSLLVGNVDDGLHLDHVCRVRRCVNPAHLEPVTCSVNSRRGSSGGSTKEDNSFSCRVCGSTNALVVRDEKSVEGRRLRCRACKDRYNSRYYAENRREIISQKMEYARANKDSINEGARRRYAARKRAIADAMEDEP